MEDSKIQTLEIYRKRVSRYFLLLFVLHIPASIAVALYFNSGVSFALFTSVAIFLAPAVVSSLMPATHLSSCVMAVAGISYSALLIHLAGGMAEFHFHIFVFLGLLTLLGSGWAICSAVVAVALYHITFFFYLPASIFSYESSFGVVMLNIFFVVLQAIPSLFIAGIIVRFAGSMGDVILKLDKQAQDLVSASNQISDSSKRLAEGTSEQASSLEETSASLEELTAMAQSNTQSVIEAKQLTDEANEAVTVGAGELKKMLQAMEDIRKSGKEVAKIIKSIDKIAFETNILALNASVEAARAGEAGTGFAVVANEVRGLAQGATSAAKETAQMIDSSIKNSQRGVEISQEVTSSLEKVFEKVKVVDQINADVANISSEQSIGFSQISRAVNEMNRVTQSSVASAEEIASAVEMLNRQTKDVQILVDELLNNSDPDTLNTVRSIW